ncbi:MAG: methyltransferase domain-containing protein [Magnetococcus sp. DMHC-6]
MYDEVYVQIGQQQKNHWWFVYRRRLAALYLSQLPMFEATKLSRYLDLGCGPGENLAFFAPRFDYAVGLDLSDVALSLAQKAHPHLQFVQGNVNHLERLFVPNSFKLITVFNVLHHQWIDSESDVLTAIYHLLEEGGVLILTEPVFDRLHRATDDLCMTKRRYQPDELRQWIEGVGLQIQAKTFFNAAPIPMAYFMAHFYQRKQSVDLSSENFVISDPSKGGELGFGGRSAQMVMERVCALEYQWIKMLGSFPFGMTYMIVAQKK